ncbi:MAG: methylmalonyl-CoA epimerase [Candidatus Lindowbacteria bacterium RIFCSPLOWO2_12_FULL_62_27]|nr:MAG: methylmalonyl-CoA epimerase [Candidatus Lindowbacteria bacterium RIFCSPLOWO2_12_FULL_62_27]
MNTSSGRAELAAWLTGLDNGDPAAVDRLAESRLDRLPYLVGVTGAAGVGKSMLLARLLDRRKPAGAGVLAVDPTHPASGGAILGDRVRMPNLPVGVFLRSVATRGGTSGLSEKLIDMAAAMKVFGHEDVFVETVGIGQDETAVRQVVDTLIVVEAPGLGDEIQAMKASPLSVADIIVVNKCDKPGAAETAAVLSETLGKKAILTSALDGAGVEELSAEIDAARHAALREDVKPAADRRKLAWRMSQALAKKWADRIARASSDWCGDGPPEGAVQGLYRRLRDILSFVPDHVAVAVPDLNEAVRAYEKLGFFLERRESFPTEGVETAFFNAGGFHIELLQPTHADSPISKFLSDRGAGLHHVAFEVDDLREVERSIKSRGLEVLGGIRPGTRGKQILFLHPKSSCRVLLEFCACAMHSEA